MIISLKKFGTILVSRQAGQEALAAFNPSLRALSPKEEITVDFDGVDVLSPSWADEFLTPLKNKYKLTLKNTHNASVKATLQMLQEVHKYSFTIASEANF